MCRRYYGIQTNQNAEIPRELFWFKSKGERDDWVADDCHWRMAISVKDARTFIMDMYHKYHNVLVDEDVSPSYWTMDRLLSWYVGCREYLILRFSLGMFGA